MTPRLYQGVEGVADTTGQLTTDHCPLSTSVVAGDAFHEECGVVAIHGHPDAARQAYLGLYALQHRGQESAGIATADGAHLANIKGMGLVSEIFTDDVLAKLPGSMAIGHTRYSTTGDSASSISATCAPVWNATALTSKPPATQKSSSSSSPTLTPTPSSTPSPTRSPRSRAHSPSS